MPNYYVHELFGNRVATKLPQPLRQAIEREPGAFRVGLFGPDPLIFSVGCLGIAQALHEGWRDQLDCLQYLLTRPNPGEAAFAAGWLCHMALDDACHPYIHQMERERGLSHMLMEISLDVCLLRENQATKPNPFRVYQKARISRLASSLVTPAKVWQYWEGLWSMGMTCNLVVATKNHWIKKMRQDYVEPTARLRRFFEESVGTASGMLTALLEGETPRQGLLGST